MRKLIIFIFIIMAIGAKSQITDTVMLPSSQYLFYCNHCGPYPQVDQKQVDAISTVGFKNVLNYGAVGNGKTLDDDAIVAAFAAADAANTGVIFPAGKTYMMKQRHTLVPHHNITVYAVGATIKEAAGGFYTGIELEYSDADFYKYNVLWIGGTYDGNKDNLSWIGSPTGNNTAMEAHGRFLGASGAKFALYYKCLMINQVMDGINIQSTLFAIIAHCKSTHSAFINFAEQGQQNTAFKARFEARDYNKTCTMYFLRDTVIDGGAMGTHVSYPTKSPMDFTSRMVMNGCLLWNCPQNAHHSEDCYKNMLHNCTIGSDPGPQYDPSSHFSNRSGIVVLDKCTIINTKVNGSNATNMRIGIAKNCTFIIQPGSRTIDNLLDNFTNAVNCTFDGAGGTSQCYADYVKDCTFRNFGNGKAVRSGMTVDNCTFINGSTSPISFGTLNGQSGKGYRNTFINCPAVTNTATNSTYLNIFKTEVRVRDVATNAFLGKINAGVQ